jgi:hypothetical protein
VLTHGLGPHRLRTFPAFAAPVEVSSQHKTGTPAVWPYGIGVRHAMRLVVRVTMRQIFTISSSDLRTLVTFRRSIYKLTLATFDKLGRSKKLVRTVLQ